jgi:hypothetical protein
LCVFASRTSARVRTVARDYEEYVHHWAAAKRNAQDWEPEEE